MSAGFWGSLGEIVTRGCHGVLTREIKYDLSDTVKNWLLSDQV